MSGPGGERAPMAKAQILLSTYNGAAFLEPLLQSLLAQDHADFSVLVREDGSSDATPAILARYAHDPRLAFYVDGHVGTAASFFDLLARADDRASFFAFCDQDDVWLPGKLARAATRLGEAPPDTPALYCGRQIVVGETLARRGLSPIPRRGPAFANALVENIAGGCTVVVNRAARQLLTRSRPGGVVHDWWSYLVVAAFGRIVYDEQPTILYRQHRRNLIGSQDVAWNRWARRVARLWREGDRLISPQQALEFGRLFGHALDPTQARLLHRFIEHRRTRRAALAYALRPDVFRQGLVDDLLLRILIALRYA
jgi:glycosyltransferase involved in cell wall biosynthesis